MADEATSETTPSTTIMVPVTKGKAMIEIDTASLSDEVYREILLQGLKVLVNRGTSKITKTTYPNDAELKTAAMAKAVEQVEAIKAGTIKFTGGKAKSTVSGAVKTEAMRLARNLVKDELKRQGEKISHYKASVITASAKELLEAPEHAETGAKLIEMAKANLEARASSKVSISLAGLKPDPELVEKAEAKKHKDQLSAKQAGMVASRAKGKPAQATAH